MFHKINYFCYPVADMERAIVFYTEILGLKLLKKGEKWSELLLGEQKIALMLQPEQAGEGGARIEFVTDQLDQVLSNLSAKGVLVQDIALSEEGPVRVIQDSEGNEIAIYGVAE